jgi:uncharacterized coiled-coil DUF342 family protein
MTTLGIVFTIIGSITTVLFGIWTIFKNFEKKAKQEGSNTFKLNMLEKTSHNLPCHEHSKSLAIIETTVSYINETLREHKEENKEQFRQIQKDFHERFIRTDDKIDNFRDEFRRKFEQTDNKIGKIDEKLEQVDERFNKIDEKFDKIDERFEKIDEKFNLMDQKFERMDEKLTQINIQINKSIEVSTNNMMEFFKNILSYQTHSNTALMAHDGAAPYNT